MIKYIKSTTIFTVIIIFLFSGCDIFKNKIEPKEEFIKIISNSNFSSEFYPKDIVQTSDNGFLILASLHNEDNAYVWQTPYIIKTDETGTVLWETTVASPFVNPIGNIIVSGGNYYFFAMHEINLTTHLLSINEADGSTTLKADYTNITYPTAASQNADGSFLVQGYDNLARETILSKISNNFSNIWTQTYPLNEDAEEILINHISKSGKQYPFFIGESNNSYFYNGLYNYTFSMVFINKLSGAALGVMNGYRYSGAVSSAINLSGNNYAYSVFNEGVNYIFPSEEINTNSINSIENISENPILELNEDATISVTTATINSKQLTVFAANTKNNQIKLYCYNAGTNDLAFYKEIAEKNPIEVTKVISTSEGGLAVLGRTYVSGQFSRIYIVKLSAKSFEK